MATQKRRENDYTKENGLCQALVKKKFTFLQKRRKVLNTHSVNCGLPQSAPPRKPTGRDKVTTRPVKESQTPTEMSCGGVKVWYNNVTAKTAVFGLQLRERDGRNEKNYKRKYNFISDTGKCF